jgi:uncharacterized protein YwqG
MTIEEVKNKLAKPAIVFETGGCLPEYSMNESWIGDVYLFAPDEDAPMNEGGNPMHPLLQLCTEGLPYLPECLSETKLITVFVSDDLPMDVTPNGHNWMLREYGHDTKLTVKKPVYPDWEVKPYPLKPLPVKQDYPVWEDEIISDDMSKEIIMLGKSKGVDYYDMVENIDGHKLGGYPAYIQNGVDYGEGFEFVLQISTDEKARLNIVDSGNIYLAKNAESGEWMFYCDFF